MLTVFVIELEPPSPVAVNCTVNVPPLVYVCFGDFSVDISDPSPKSHT
jgi:hypothetical protein